MNYRYAAELLEKGKHHAGTFQIFPCLQPKRKGTIPVIFPVSYKYGIDMQSNYTEYDHYILFTKVLSRKYAKVQ